jgi:hypothetical protein
MISYVGEFALHAVFYLPPTSSRCGRNFSPWSSPKELVIPRVRASVPSMIARLQETYSG